MCTHAREIVKYINESHIEKYKEQIGYIIEMNYSS